MTDQATPVEHPSEPEPVGTKADGPSRLSPTVCGHGPELDRLTAELADYDERAEQQKQRADEAEQHLRNIASGGPRADAVQAEIGEMIRQTHELRDQLRRAEARPAVVHNDWPAGRWLHVTFTSPDETTANTSALNLRDHLAAEFPGVGMRISSNATEVGVSLAPAEAARLAQSGIATSGCDCGHQGMGISWHGDDCPWRSGVLDGATPEQPARTTPDNPPTGENAPDNPAATEATGLPTRVTALYEQWVKAGPPPLGVPTARWWDRRLVELGNAIRPPEETP